MAAAQVFRYEGDQTTPAFDVKAHGESCRSVRFTQSGELLLSASADCSILATDTATGQPAARLEDAHPDGINRLECIGRTLHSALPIIISIPTKRMMNDALPSSLSRPSRLWPFLLPHESRSIPVSISICKS